MRGIESDVDGPTGNDLLWRFFVRCLLDLFPHFFEICVLLTWLMEKLRAFCANYVVILSCNFIM